MKAYKVKKGFFGLMITVFMVAGMAACGQKAVEPDVSDVQDVPEGTVEEDQSQHIETIEMDGDEISVALPDGWDARGAEEISVSLPLTKWSRSMEITPPSSEKANAKVTVGNTESGRPLTMEQFDDVIETRAEVLLPHAVEESPKYTYVQLKNGYGKHFTLTDASLVGGVPAPDEYLYITTYYVTNNKGYLIYSTLLHDEKDSEILTTMLDIVSSVDASFSETPPAGAGSSSAGAGSPSDGAGPPPRVTPDMFPDSILPEMVSKFEGYELSVDENPLIGIYELEAGGNMVLAPMGGYLWQGDDLAVITEGQYQIFMGAIGESGEIVTETDTGPVFTVIIYYTDIGAPSPFTVQVFDDQGGDFFIVTDLMNDFSYGAQWRYGLSYE